MDNTTYVALSRMTAQQRAMDVSAENVANTGTPGYKATRVLFSDWIARQQDTSAPRGGRAIAYTQDRATYRDHRDGPLTHTANPFDLAIVGDGYFSVDTPRGPRLTRAGRFGLLPDGTVADSTGNRLLDAVGQPLRLAVADTQVTIAGDGTISSENGRIGKVGVVLPDDPMQLQAEGGSLFLSKSGTAPVGQPKIVQGAVEDSNVRPVLEMTRMMRDLREFQFASQLVQAEADRHQSAIDKILSTRR